MFIISHLSLPTQLGQKKMFTQLESQFGMILIFDRDHLSTVPGSRITKVFKKKLFSNSSNLLKVFCFHYFENQANAVKSLASLANNYLFLEIRTALIVQKRMQKGKRQGPTLAVMPAEKSTIQLSHMLHPNTRGPYFESLAIG